MEAPKASCNYIIQSQIGEASWWCTTCTEVRRAGGTVFSPWTKAFDLRSIKSTELSMSVPTTRLQPDIIQSSLHEGIWNWLPSDIPPLTFQLISTRWFHILQVFLVIILTGKEGRSGGTTAKSSFLASLNPSRWGRSSNSVPDRPPPHKDPISLHKPSSNTSLLNHKCRMNASSRFKKCSHW